MFYSFFYDIKNIDFCTIFVYNTIKTVKEYFYDWQYDKKNKKR